MSRPDARDPLSDEDAHAVFDLLVSGAGAAEMDREAFVTVQSSRYVPEYRFMGSLGFGGKFWRHETFLPDGSLGERWCVTAYREDETPEIRQAVADTTAALMAVLGRRVMKR